MTNRENRLAYKRACQLDPGLRERDNAAYAERCEQRHQAILARSETALRIRAERAGEDGPRIELIVAVAGGIERITLRVRPDYLHAGARESISAGLLTTWNADDASTLIVRTGRTRGEARRAEYVYLQKLGEATGRRYAEAYGRTDGWDDPEPETERVHHTGAWHPESETPEEYLDRTLGAYAGRIVRAGLNT